MTGVSSATIINLPHRVPRRFAGSEVSGLGVCFATLVPDSKMRFFVLCQESSATREGGSIIYAMPRRLVSILRIAAIAYGILIVVLYTCSFLVPQDGPFRRLYFFHGEWAIEFFPENDVYFNIRHWTTVNASSLWASVGYFGMVAIALAPVTLVFVCNKVGLLRNHPD